MRGKPLGRGALIAADCLLAVAYVLVAWGTAAVPLALAVAVRRVWPVQAFLVAAAGSAVAAVFGALPDPFLVVALTAYTAAAFGRRPHGRGWLVPGAVTGVLLLFGVSAGTPRPLDHRLALLLPGLALAGGMWSAGAAVRERRAYAEWRSSEQVARAVTEERLRIAREVHDIVTHSLGVIAVKASVARHVADSRPAEAVTSLETIERVSKAALGEMRQALRALRTSDGTPLEPSPGLAELGDLVAGARAAGIAVEADLTRDDTVPAVVASAAYRIVQEALTNVLRHAGRTRCRVTVHCAGRELTIEVRDSGPSAVHEASAGSGFGFFGPSGVHEALAGSGLGSDGLGFSGPSGVHEASTGSGLGLSGLGLSGLGLAGMRERVAVHGGEFSAGPDGSGGYRVHARIPYGEHS